MCEGHSYQSSTDDMVLGMTVYHTLLCCNVYSLSDLELQDQEALGQKVIAFGEHHLEKPVRLLLVTGQDSLQLRATPSLGLESCHPHLLSGYAFSVAPGCYSFLPVSYKKQSLPLALPPL